jgi:NAD-dependent DNA ligase
MKRPEKETIERLAKLRAAIDHYREQYHVYDKEEISPEALDSLKDELVHAIAARCRKAACGFQEGEAQGATVVTW